MLESRCGIYDTDSFFASFMCCACGGGATIGGCRSTDFNPLDGIRLADTDGDGCDYYERFPEDCGYWDTDDFSADDLCCACGGGESFDIHDDDDNGEKADRYGDNCADYADNPEWCGYNDGTFNSDSMCTVCGGGYLGWASN